jgi:hypothetical protein
MRELRGDLRAQSAYYANEARHRAILRLIIPEILVEIPADEVEQTNQMDSLLRALTQPGPFVWEPEVENAFPWEGFWFLYVAIRK